MWGFRRDPLNQTAPRSTAEYLCRLMEEQNSLLRELLDALGHSARTPRHRPLEAKLGPPKTAADVTRVSRTDLANDLYRQRIEREEAQIAPWRTTGNGPASGPTAPNSGPKSDATDPGASPTG